MTNQNSTSKHTTVKRYAVTATGYKTHAAMTTTTSVTNYGDALREVATMRSLGWHAVTITPVEAQMYVGAGVTDTTLLRKTASEKPRWMELSNSGSATREDRAFAALRASARRVRRSA